MPSSSEEVEVYWLFAYWGGRWGVTIGSRRDWRARDLQLDIYVGLALLESSDDRKAHLGQGLRSLEPPAVGNAVWLFLDIQTTSKSAVANNA